MSLEHKHSILLVDDEVSITKALQRLFRKEGYHILTASSGQEGLELLEKAEKSVSLIISDQRMPEMNGAQFLEKAKEIFPDAIRFLLTGYSDMDAIVDAVNKGEIHRYLTKPWNDDDLLLQVRQGLEQHELVLENRRLLVLTNKQNKELNELNKDLEKKVEERTREIIEKNKELEESNIKLEKSFMDTIRLLASLIESLNPKLGRYMRHVAELAREVAEEYGLEKKDLDQIEMAGMIHDIGMLGVPEEVLKKDRIDMNEAEFNMYSQHPVIGSVCFDSVEQLSEIGEIILYHHENFDGSGFPNGLSGEKIPLGSRIIAAVSDYCMILDMWPKETSQIILRMRKYLGEGTTKNFAVTDVDDMIGKIANKIILLGGQQKYDIEVVTKLMKRVGETVTIGKTKKKNEKRILLNNLDKLKEGVVMARDLRVKDGRLLLGKGMTLKEASLDSIRKLAEKGLLEDNVYVAL